MSSEMIDPYIAAQIEARKKPSVIKIKLINMRSMYPEGLIIAIEGEDDKPVYSRWIGRAAPTLSCEILICDGKRSARQLKNILIEDLNDLAHDVKIIVDRDFDDLVGFVQTDNVFMLDRYSFENFLVNTGVLDRMLSIAYPCNGFPGLREKICTIFHSDFHEFLIATKGLNERIFLARRLNIDIDGKIPKSIDAVANVSLASTTAVAHDPSAIIPFDINEEYDSERIGIEFASLDPETRYRGKFSWKFFTKWLDCLAYEFRNSQMGLFSGVPEGGRINHGELTMGALAALCSLPDGLDAFLAA